MMKLLLIAQDYFHDCSFLLNVIYAACGKMGYFGIALTRQATLMFLYPYSMKAFKHR